MLWSLHQTNYYKIKINIDHLSNSNMYNVHRDIQFLTIVLV